MTAYPVAETLAFAAMKRRLKRQFRSAKDRDAALQVSLAATDNRIRIAASIPRVSLLDGRVLGALETVEGVGRSGGSGDGAKPVSGAENAVYGGADKWTG